MVITQRSPTTGLPRQKKRIRQSERFFRLAKECHRAVQDAGAGAAHEKRLEMMDYTEAFYLFAFRLGEVVEKLPDAGKCKPIGVRDVRNKLILHSERHDSRVLFGSFALSELEGPRLKPIRTRELRSVFQDAGLYPNAGELQKAVEAALRRAINATPKGLESDREVNGPMNVRRLNTSDNSVEAYCDFDLCSWFSVRSSEEEAITALQTHYLQTHS